MSVHLVTGYAGKAHITSDDQRHFNAGIIGENKYVLDVGGRFAYELVSNNLINIKSGELLNQGAHIRINENDYEECIIENGLQSVKRNDLIVVRYTKKDDTSIESASIVVIKGTSGEVPKDPEYIQGNILKGELVDDFPLYRVCINGLNVEKVEPLFSVVMTLADIGKKMEEVLYALSETLSTK